MYYVYLIRILHSVYTLMTVRLFYYTLECVVWDPK